MGLQPAAKRELFHISVGVLAFSAVMHLVFILLRRWELPVLWGNLLGGGFAVLNFLLLALTVQAVAVESDENRAKLKLRSSYSMRMMLTVLVVIVSIVAPVFSWPAAVLSLFFPRLTILAMQMMGMYKPEKRPKT